MNLKNIKNFVSKHKKLFIGITLLFIIGLGIFLYFILKPTSNSGSLCKPTENICKNNASSMYNKCVPSDYCGGDKYGYTYNKDDCLCHLPCGKGQSEYPPGIEMVKQPDGSWFPREPIGCSQDSTCQYRSPPGPCPGGKGIFCGKSIDVNGNILFSGCLNDTDFKPCGTTYCKLSDFDCHTDKNGYCSVKGCPADTFIPCITSGDCTYPGTTGNCNKGDKVLIDKEITDVGYCDNSASISSVSNTCLKNTEIGQIGESGDIKIVPCKDSIGVNVKKQQCDTFLKNNCANMMCNDPFKWLATDDKNNCSDEQLCCPSGQRVVSVGKNPFCCATNTNDGCLNSTLYGYASGMLTDVGGSTDTIKCSMTNDPICSNQNPNLIKQLSGDSTLGDNNYVNMYCDTTDRVCKAKCGYKNQSAESTNTYSVVDVKNDDDPSKSYSFCRLNNNNCVLNDGQDYTYGIVNDIPICINGDNMYWSQVDGNAEYTTQFKTKFQSRNKTPCDISVCGSQQKFLQNVFNMEIENDASGGGTCTFNQTCNSLLVKPTGATDNIKWSDLKDPVKLNAIMPSGSTVPTGWDKYPIYQTKPDQKPGPTGCQGDSHGFNTNLTKSPQADPSPGSHVCRDDIPQDSDKVFEWRGKYCPINICGECVSGRDPFTC
jgi:hypothetical protein